MKSLVFSVSSKLLEEIGKPPLPPQKSSKYSQNEIIVLIPTLMIKKLIGVGGFCFHFSSCDRFCYVVQLTSDS